MERCIKYQKIYPYSVWIHLECICWLDTKPYTRKIDKHEYLVAKIKIALKTHLWRYYRLNKKNYELEDLVSGGDEIYKSMNEKQREVVDALINKINRQHHELYGLRNTKNKYGEKIRKISGYTY